MLSLERDHPFLCKLPILFSTMKLRLSHIFSRFIHKSKIWILKYWSWALYTSQFLPIHKSGGLGFLKSLGCTTKFLPVNENV